MEVENKYASKAVGGTALGLSIGSLASQALTGNLGSLGNILSGGNNNNYYCLEQIMNRDKEIAELKAEKYSDKIGNELYRYVDGRFREFEARFEQQVAYNATNTATIGCLTQQVAALQCMLNGLTKTVIPKTNICPEPMPQYNSWTAPTAGATT